MATSTFYATAIKRKYFILSVVICFSVFNFFCYRGPAISDSIVVNSEKLMLLFRHFHKRHKELKNFNTRSRAYDEILAQTNLYDFLRLNSLDERCDAYFQFLALNDPEWSIDPNSDVTYSKDFTDFKVYKEKIGNDDNRLISEAKSKGTKPPKPHTEEEIKKKYEEMKAKGLDVERNLHDFISHIRVFDKCYIKTHQNDRKFVAKQRDFLNNEVTYNREKESDAGRAQLLSGEVGLVSAEKKIFPWLTFKYPTFKRWDGSTAVFPGKDYTQHDNGGSFMRDFKKRLNGRGIVMTLADSHIPAASRLLRVLRAQKNKYPIQVIYHDSLSDESQKKLIKIARAEYKGFPKQDIWFVDGKKAIEGQYLSKFSGFSNKILACVLTTFEEYIFLDADAVVLKELSFFFNHKRYLKTGTLFFQDRMIPYHRGGADVGILKKMLPSIEDSIVFNIPQTTNLTMNNEFMRGLNHFMESGLVVINKKRHFMQPFMMSIMNFFDPIVGSFYGDKEHFWTSLALVGDENYAFNGNPAAAIGELTPEYERHKDVNKVQSFQSKELCSNHPAHINEYDDTLMWFNSGFQWCGRADKVDVEKEFKIGSRLTFLKSHEDFKEFITSPLKIKQAIIPPRIIAHESIEQNVENEPTVPWAQTAYCDNYCWCSYSLIGGYYKNGDATMSNRREGRVIEFPEKEREHFEVISKIWNEPLN